MKKIKKMLALGLVFCMFASLVGCGNNNGAETENSTQVVEENSNDGATSGEKTKITWWVWATVDIANQMAKSAFEANPELAEKYEIEAVLVPDMVPKFRMELATGGVMPDIVMFPAEALPEFAYDDILTDVSDIVAPYKDKLTSGAYSLVTCRDKQWAFPYQVKPSVWTYRSDIFNEVGIDVTKVKTADDFIAAGKQLQAVYPESYMWAFNSSQMSADLLVHIMSGNGGSFFDENGNYIFDKDPGVRAALEDIKKIYDSGIVYDVVVDSTDHQQGFANGTIVSDLTGTWIKNNLKNWSPDLVGIWEETLWPELGGAAPGGMGGSMFVIPANAKNPEAAKEILSALSLTVDGNLNAYKERSIYPPLREAVENELLKQPHPYMGASLYEAEALATENFRTFNYSPKYSSEMEIVIPYVAKYLQGQATLDEILVDANNDLTVQLGNAFDD